MMVRVTRTPMYGLPIGLPDKERTAFLGDTEKKLREFISEHNMMSPIKYGYNHFEILVRSPNTTEWDKRLHDEMLKKFPVILYRVERQECFEKNRYSVVMLYHYIPKYVKDKWNEMVGMDIREVRL